MFYQHEISHGVRCEPVNILPTQNIHHEQHNTQYGSLAVSPISDDDMDCSPVIFTSQYHTYTIHTYPPGITHQELWMRSVNKHLSSLKTPKPQRKSLFISTFGDSKVALALWKKRYTKKERNYPPSKRVSFKFDTREMIAKEDANKRAVKRIRRAAYTISNLHSESFIQIATLIRHGLLKSGGKYEQFRRAHANVSKGKGTYGVPVAKYPSSHTVKALANALYKSADILTNTPEWSLAYRKGRLKIVDEYLLLPSQQLTLSHISTDYKTDADVTQAINQKLADEHQSAIAIKVRKQGSQLGVTAIAAHVYFESSYHTRCAIRTLKSLGRVSLGRTIVTARVIASKVDDVIRMLLSEANGWLATDLNPAEVKALEENYKTTVLLQEWIDKDGRVSFIKVKLVDPSHHVFKHGESRVAYLLEFVGDESECRRFYPALVDQFDLCNRTTFTLLNGLKLNVSVELSTGDHKAAWAKTGRSGGHDKRDLFSNHSSAAMYHLIAFQDKPYFRYSRHVDTWKTINREMEKWTNAQLSARVIVTKVAKKVQLMKLYNVHGRVERVPALANGEQAEVASVHQKLLITPLVLHNQTYCCLATLGVGLENFITSDSKQRNKLHGRYKGLCDGIGTTKCATSGSGIRVLCNDALILESDHLPEFEKFSPLWYLIDTICHHLHMKNRNEQGIHCALLDHERLCFSSCTFLWWLLLGDASETIGGRTLKTGNKNHLQDKVYAYELVNACPEWEEHIRIPLSLIDESVFEASFSFRDEAITASRSKVDIEAERITAFFKRGLNVLAPNRKYRSFIAGMPRHQRRNMIVLACWRTQTKWSFNIATGFLPRIAQYSYHSRVTMSSDHAIHFNVKGPVDPFYTSTPPPDLIICACGQCDVNTPPTEFPTTLRQWWSAKRIQRAWYKHRLRTWHPISLKRAHLKRAITYRTQLEAQLHLSDAKQDIHEIMKLYEGYNLYRSMYPGVGNGLTEFKTTARLTTIITRINNLANRQAEQWNGDFQSIPCEIENIISDRSWTCDLLRSVLRFFKLHGCKVRLSCNKASLIAQVQPLLAQYKTI